MLTSRAGARIAAVPKTEVRQTTVEVPLSPGMEVQTLSLAATTSKLARMPYSNCSTTTVDLSNLHLPEDATEEQYRAIYQRYVKTKSPTALLLESAVQSLTTGIAPPVAFPTETVYGLAADATNAAAVAGIFAAKGRPADNPLIVHAASKEHIERLIGQPLPKIYDSLVEKHWPGPLTVLVPVPARSPIAPNVHPGQKTIGFRVPQSKFARFFIAATGRPLAAPSANTSGRPSPTTAQHVMDDFSGKINYIIDGGNCDIGLESTVVDGLQTPPVILRPGGVSRQDLVEHGKRTGTRWADVKAGYKDSRSSGSDTGTAPRAPGMKYKHYSPKGRLILFEGCEKVASRLELLLPELRSMNLAANADAERKFTPLAILTSSTWAHFADLEGSGVVKKSRLGRESQAGRHNVVFMTAKDKSGNLYRIYSIPLGKDSSEVGQSLFAALRTCDDLKCNLIFAEAPKLGKGRAGRDHEAVVERMRKASTAVVQAQ